MVGYDSIAPYKKLIVDGLDSLIRSNHSLMSELIKLHINTPKKEWGNFYEAIAQIIGDGNQHPHIRAALIDSTSTFHIAPQLEGIVKSVAEEIGYVPIPEGEGYVGKEPLTAAVDIFIKRIKRGRELLSNLTDYKQLIVDALEGKDVPEERRERHLNYFGGYELVILLYNATSGDKRDSFIKAMGQIIEDDAQSLITRVQVIDLARSWDISELEASVRKIADTPEASEDPLKGVVQGFIFYVEKTRNR